VITRPTSASFPLKADVSNATANGVAVAVGGSDLGGSSGGSATGVAVGGTVVGVFVDGKGVAVAVGGIGVAVCVGISGVGVLGSDVAVDVLMGVAVGGPVVAVAADAGVVVPVSTATGVGDDGAGVMPPGVAATTGIRILESRLVVGVGVAGKATTLT